jgi:hypothetical protein
MGNVGIPSFVCIAKNGKTHLVILALSDFMTADDVLEESQLPLYNAFVSA